MISPQAAIGTVPSGQDSPSAGPLFPSSPANTLARDIAPTRLCACVCTYREGRRKRGGGGGG